MSTLKHDDKPDATLMQSSSKESGVGPRSSIVSRTPVAATAATRRGSLTSCQCRHASMDAVGRRPGSRQHASGGSWLSQYCAMFQRGTAHQHRLRRTLSSLLAKERMLWQPKTRYVPFWPNLICLTVGLLTILIKGHFHIALSASFNSFKHT